MAKKKAKTPKKAKKKAAKKKASKKNSFVSDAEIISDRMVEFTHKFATWYAELPKFEGERKINQDKAENLRKQMFEGKWSEGHGEISVAVFPDGTTFRLNGQHRCWARFLLDDENFKPKMRLVTYRVKDNDDYRKLYIRFDNPSTHQVRSSSHLVQMALFGTEEFANVSKAACAKVAMGYKFWQYGANNAGRKASIERICDELRGEANARARNAAEIIGSILANKKSVGHMARAPVYGAIFETFKYVTKAREFWQTVIDGLFDKKTDPAKILNDYLHRTGLGNKCRTREVTKLATADEMYNVCIRCFNFWVTGRPLSKTPPSNGPRATARM